MNHYNVGIRYMFNEKFGAKVAYKLDHFVNDPGGKLELPIAQLPYLEFIMWVNN